MGRSRRRMKRHRPVVKSIKKKPKRRETALPEEVKRGSVQQIAEKLGKEITWTTRQTLTKNYKANGLVLDPNEGFGRSGPVDIFKEKAQQAEEGTLEFESDDDLRTLEGRERKSGKAPPRKLTAHQTQIVGALVQAHGADNIEAMVRDVKLNRMLLPASKLKKMVAAFQRYGERDRCGFRVPTKRLW